MKCGDQRECGEQKRTPQKVQEEETERGTVCVCSRPTGGWMSTGGRRAWLLLEGHPDLCFCFFCVLGKPHNLCKIVFLRCPPGGPERGALGRVGRQQEGEGERGAKKVAQGKMADEGISSGGAWVVTAGGDQQVRRAALPPMVEKHGRTCRHARGRGVGGPIILLTGPCFFLEGLHHSVGGGTELSLCAAGGGQHGKSSYCASTTAAVAATASTSSERRRRLLE